MPEIILPNNGLITNNPTFEKFEINESLFILREQTKKQVIGYVSKHPTNNHWFWFMANTISVEFHTFDEASDDLMQTFMTHRMNAMAKKMGTIDNEHLTKF